MSHLYNVILKMTLKRCVIFRGLNHPQLNLEGIPSCRLSIEMILMTHSRIQFIEHNLKLVQNKQRYLVYVRKKGNIR